MNTSHYQFECMININIYSSNIIHQFGLFTSLIIFKKTKQLGRFSFPKLFLFIIINHFQSHVLLFSVNAKFHDFIFIYYSLLHIKKIKKYIYIRRESKKLTLLLKNGICGLSFVFKYVRDV